MATPLAAASAYSNLARLSPASDALGKAGGAAAGAASPEQGFGSILKQALNTIGEASHKADSQTAAMVNNKANVVDVVTAVAETEVAVSTLVAVRDRVISAYEEIMRMPI